MRRPRSTAEQGKADKALEERNLLYRRYRASRAAYRDNLIKTHPCGPELGFFADQLKRYTQLVDASAMLAFVREHARGWLSVAPPEIRAEALSLINERIIAARLRAGLTPFDDPLPDEADDVFQLCRQELT